MSQLDDEDIENLLQQSDLEDIGDDEDDTWAPDAENDGLSDDSEDDMPLSSLPISRESDDGKWIKKKFRGRPTAVQQPPDPGEPPKSPAEYFENYFTGELFEQFSTATSQYYIAEKGCAMKPQCSPVNSWFEYRENAKRNNLHKSKIMDLLSFRLSIVEYLLGEPTRKRTRDDLELAEMPSTSEYRPAPMPTVDKRYDGYNHWPIFDTLPAPRKCSRLSLTVLTNSMAPVETIVTLTIVTQ
ncbi:unnamed protein product [Parnassius apollo]|uniref:(apollo) hypothetical protein n=1 Tax=Parnassius apollo TaxID=110799 RepID=A0A8S3XPU3_PARAO|nr:unnamed protein product [Parnassius apollo]